MRPFDRRLLGIAAPARGYLALTAVVGLGVACLVLVQAWAVADAVSAVQLHHADLGGVRVPLTVLVLAVAARALLAGVQEWAGHRAAARVQQAVRQAVLARSTATARRERVGAGPRAILVTRGLDALEPYLTRFLPQAVLAVVVPPLVLLQIGWIDPVSGVIVLVTLPLIPLFMVLVGRHTRQRTDRQWRALSVLSGHFLDVVQGLPTLKVFGRARAQTDAIRRVSEEHRRATERTLRLAFLSAFVLELAATLSVAVVAVGIGLRLLDGRLDLRTALVVLVLAPEAYLPIRNVGAAFHASAEGASVVAEASELLEASVRPPGDLVAPPGPVAVAVRGAARRGAGPDTVRLPPTDLTVRPGEAVAVLGPSGCGKSTLIELLLGWETPDEGDVTVSGLEVRDLDPEGWLARVAWLPQRPLLVAGTLADNVRLGEPDARDDEVAAALDAAGADFVEGQPHRLATVLGEHGSGLSAGQRQRVAVARLLLRIARRDPGLVLLDEPTAHLDRATERTVAAALAAACRDRTTLVVTHRRAAAAWADRVVHLGAGAPVRPTVGVPA